MTKNELVSCIATDLGLSKDLVRGLLAELVNIAIREAKENSIFNIPGLGLLLKTHRKAGMGRNPQTGEPIKIKADPIVKFRVAKILKDLVLLNRPSRKSSYSWDVKTRPRAGKPAEVIALPGEIEMSDEIETHGNTAAVGHEVTVHRGDSVGRNPQVGERVRTKGKTVDKFREILEELPRNSSSLSAIKLKRRDTTRRIKALERAAKPKKKKTEGKEEVSVTRYPKIDLTGTVRPANEVTLTVDLALLPDPRTESSGVRITAIEGWTELPIRTEITAPDLRFKPRQDSGTIIVKNGAASEPYTVKATVANNLKKQAVIEVRATFYYEDRNCGNARRAFPISQGLQAAPSFAVATKADAAVAAAAVALMEKLAAGKIADEVIAMDLPKKSVIPEPQRESPPIGHTAGSMVAPFGADPPKLTIEIHLFDSRNPGEQTWHLRVPENVRDECILPKSLTGKIHLKKDEARFVAELFEKLDQTEPGQHMTFFQGLGDHLYELTPPCFGAVYWALFDKYGTFPIQILSDDPYMPWELTRPSRPDNDKAHHDWEMLCRRHPVGRWFLGKEGIMPVRLKSGKVATIAPDYSKRQLKGLKPLLSAQAESKTICAKLGANAIPVTGRLQNVIEMFEDAKKVDIGMVHYAGHGVSKTKHAELAHLLLEDTDLGVYDIRRKETQLGKNRHSLVFFNACEVGASGLNLGVIGGFAEALTEDEFGGFVAPLWAVYDVDASTVVLEFLQHVLLWAKDERQTFATALQNIRSEFGEQSPTFLSYTYYGDVMARFV